jgi:hypothetical protein
VKLGKLETQRFYTDIPPSLAYFDRLPLNIIGCC